MLLQLLVKKEGLDEDLTCQLVLEELSILNENDDDEEWTFLLQDKDKTTTLTNIQYTMKTSLVFLILMTMLLFRQTSLIAVYDLETFICVFSITIRPTIRSSHK